MALEVFRALARSFMCVESYCFVCVSFMAHKKKILGMKTKLSFSFEELFTLWFHAFILLMHLSHFPEPSSLIPCPLPCGGGGYPLLNKCALSHLLWALTEHGSEVIYSSKNNHLLKTLFSGVHFGLFAKLWWLEVHDLTARSRFHSTNRYVYNCATTMFF